MSAPSSDSSDATAVTEDDTSRPGPHLPVRPARRAPSARRRLCAALPLLPVAASAPAAGPAAGPAAEPARAAGDHGWVLRDDDR